MMEEYEAERSPWRTGSPTPWILKVFGGSPKGVTAWMSKVVLGLALLSVGLFSVTRLMLIHWVILVPASLGTLFALGIVYILLEMRRQPVVTLDLRPEGLSILRPGKDPQRIPLHQVRIRDCPGEYRFDLLSLPGDALLCTVARDSVRDVSLYETIRRYLLVPSSRRPPLPSGGSRSRFYRWFLGIWGLIILLMVLWALYENYAAPRSYEPFVNP